MRGEWYRNIPIQQKFYLLIFVFVLAPSLFMIALWSMQSNRTVERNASDYSELLVRQLTERLDAYFDELENDVSPLLTNELAVRFMTTDPLNRYDMFTMSREIQDDLFSGFTFSRAELQNISLISKSGGSVSSQGGFDPERRYLEIEDEMAERGNFRIAGPSPYYSSSTVTAVQKIHSIYSGETIGYLLLDIDLNRIVHYMRDAKLGDTGFVWIADPESRTELYHSDRNAKGASIAPETFDLVRQGELSSERVGETLFTYGTSRTTGWVVVSEVPFAELTRNLDRLWLWTLAIVVILVSIALSLAGAFSFSITRALKRLQRQMRKAGAGDYSLLPESHKHFHEINLLNRGYNDMVKEIQRYIEVVHHAEMRTKDLEIRQRESRIKQLQAQINPHFLYNSLEFINSFAIVSGILPISRMADALARLFRYSVKSVDDVVPLREELDHIRIYLQIQKDRNSDFEVEWTETAAVDRATALRFVLQPIVENALIHGYQRHKISADYLRIEVRAEGEDAVVTVADRGGGMPPALMEEYNHYFREGRWLSFKEEDSRLGLANVHERLRLRFGEPYGVTIVRTSPEGTAIEVRIPGKERAGDV